MKKKLVAPMILTILTVALATIPTTRMTYAQCGCSCVILCNNKCEFQCTSCGLIEGAKASTRCCEEGRKAIGDPGRCPEGVNTY